MPFMHAFQFGLTTTGLPITGYNFGSEGPRILILGGVHGDEIEGVWAALGLLEKFQQKFEFKIRLTLVPMFNLDGVLAKDRRNANKVDLNRNLPTKDWSPTVATERYHPGKSANSESENHALVKFIDTEKPKFIMSLHSYKPMLNVNGDCSGEVEILREKTGYIITEDMGYPTPGALGTYGGREGRAPVLTYEIERGLDQASVLKIHVPAIIASLSASEKRN